MTPGRQRLWRTASMKASSRQCRCAVCLFLTWSARLWGKLFADRGSISAPLTAQLFEQGRGAHHPLSQEHAQTTLCSCQTSSSCVNERTPSSIIDQLKNISETLAIAALSILLLIRVAGLIASTHQDKKPGLHLSRAGTLFGLIALT
jgi:hypothetical protein